MESRWIPRWIPIIGLALGVLLAGCSIRRPVSRQAVNYNLALELAQNQVMLLNVVRASKREPRHYSSITQVRSSVSGTLSPSINIPLGADRTNLFPLALGVSGTSGGTADVAVLDSKKFVQGILNPISVDQLEYYLEQGWPPEFLLMLFVRKLVIAGQSYENYPTDGFASLELYQRKIRELLATPEGLKIRTVKPPPAVGPPFKLSRSEGLAKQILEAEKAGLALTCAPTTDDPGTPGSRAAKIEELQRAVSEDSPLNCQFRQKSGPKRIFLGGTAVPTAQEGRLAGNNVIFFRSTDAIIYYLGEIIRHQGPGQMKPVVRWQRPDGVAEDVLLFVARERAGDGESLVEVKHGGATWIIPSTSDHAHRSLAVFSILSQLIGLNKERTELPTTGVVTVVGG